MSRLLRRSKKSSGRRAFEKGKAFELYCFNVFKRLGNRAVMDVELIDAHGNKSQIVRVYCCFVVFAPN